MELRQLRSFIALVENDFSVSRTAKALFLVQSAVSQQIKSLEEELSTRLFVRNGKRLTGLTNVGETVLHYAERTMADTQNILDACREHVEHNSGLLRIGATHTQARYILPPVIRSFNRDYPNIVLQIHQGTPKQLVELAMKNIVDFSICTEALASQPELTSIPCYKWNRSLIVKPGHPLLEEDITLETLCNHPLVTYEYGFTGRGTFNATFADAGLTPHVVLSAADTDVIKTYVREGMGAGIIASMAYTPNQDSDLLQKDLSHLFPWEQTKIAYQKDKYLRRYQIHFIELFQSCISQPERWFGLVPTDLVPLPNGQLNTQINKR
ncbi:MAG: LysR family transcriptional regulator [Gammaproteobacteria bacterium]|nr:LysR family transcriptional regulator [Gammaproteobacteria bacterium]